MTFCMAALTVPSMDWSAKELREGHRKRRVRPSRLRLVVEHPVRLEILSLLEGECFTVSELSSRIGRDEEKLAYHVERLALAGLAQETDRMGESGYVVTLKRKPCWVARSVNEHRQGSWKALPPRQPRG